MSDWSTAFAKQVESSSHTSAIDDDDPFFQRTSSKNDGVSNVMHTVLTKVVAEVGTEEKKRKRKRPYLDEGTLLLP